MKHIAACLLALTTPSLIQSLDYLQDGVKIGQLKSILGYLPETIFIPYAQAQAKAIYVESWKRGESDIQEQTIMVELSSDQEKYESVISNRSGQVKYSLKIDFRLMPNASRVEYYVVSLSEIARVPKSDKRLQNHNLLVREGPPPSGDFFPKENSVGDFFPLEEIPYLKYGFMGYPISAKRVIKVEGFYCVIQAIKYKINTEKQGAFDSLTLQIEFRNKYEGS